MTSPRLWGQLAVDSRHTSRRNPPPTVRGRMDNGSVAAKVFEYRGLGFWQKVSCFGVCGLLLEDRVLHGRSTNATLKIRYELLTLKRWKD